MKVKNADLNFQESCPLLIVAAGLYCIVLRLHSHTQGARLSTCIAVTRYSQNTWKSTRI